MNNEVKLKIKKNIFEEWGDGFYYYESWKKINIKIENYFKSKNFITKLYIIKTNPHLYILLLEWDKTQRYEDYL